MTKYYKEEFRRSNVVYYYKVIDDACWYSLDFKHEWFRCANIYTLNRFEDTIKEISEADMMLEML
jgi:hypothetical protein